MNKQRKKHAERRAYGHAWSLVFDVPWLIEPSKLEDIGEFLTLRRSGKTFTDEEIRERCGFFDDEDDEDDKPYTLLDGVAVLPIMGTMVPRAGGIMRSSGLASVERLTADFKAALADEKVGGILLHVDSPGGSATATPEFADAIYEARSKKPIWTITTGTMASGAYWAGTAAARVFASPSAMSGSIGVYMMHQDVSKSEERVGRKTTLISAGTHKVDAHPFEPLSEQSRQTLQERVDAINRNFVAAIARNRGTSVETVQANYGQGKVYLAAEALRAGMIDGVQTYEQTLAGLQAMVKQSNFVPRVAGQQPNFPAAGVAAQPVTLNGGSPVNAKIKAALFARGLCKIDDTDEVATSHLNSFFAGRCQPVPSDEAALISAIFMSPPKPGEMITLQKGDDVEKPSTGVITDAQREQIATAERERINDLQSRGALLKISAEEIQAAVDGKLTGDQAAAKWTKTMAANRQPVTGNDRIEGGPSQLETFTAAATDLILMRIGSALATSTNPDAQKCKLTLKDDNGKDRAPHPAVRDMQHMQLFDLAFETLKAANIDMRGMDREDIAAKFLAMTGRDKVSFRQIDAMTNGPTYNSPSMYPNLLSAVGSKMLDTLMTPEPGTYREWAKPLPSVPDFNPRTIVSYASGGELPRLLDHKNFPESTLAEGANWIATEEFGEKFGATARMIAGNDLGIFTDIFPGQAIKMDRTINRLCINLLLSNPTLPDGTALFSTDTSVRGNLISQSNVDITVANVSLARLAMRRFRNLGGEDNLSLSPVLALLPPERETEGEQFFLPNIAIPTADTAINTFKNKIKPVVETMLTDAQDWFLFASWMRAAAVVYMHQQGFESGKRQTWYDPDYRTQWFSIEARVGAAINNWRGVLMLQDNDT